MKRSETVIVVLVCFLFVEILVAYIVSDQPDPPSGLRAVGVGAGVGWGDIVRPGNGDCDGNCGFCSVWNHNLGHMECNICYECDHVRYENITR